MLCSQLMLDRRARICAFFRAPFALALSEEALRLLQGKTRGTPALFSPYSRGHKPPCLNGCSPHVDGPRSDCFSPSALAVPNDEIHSGARFGSVELGSAKDDGTKAKFTYVAHCVRPPMMALVL